MPDLKLSEDAHNRVVVLFEMGTPLIKDKPNLVALQVQWILEHGHPLDPTTGIKMKYHGTHIVQ
jgi:hypothetical protein